MSAQCDTCTNDFNAIKYIGSNQYEATTAQAYFWDICQGSATISGSNKGKIVTVNCNSNLGNSHLRLTRFDTGHCMKSCYIVKCDSIVDTLHCSCNKFSDSCIALLLTPCKIKANFLCIDTLCIDSIKWQVTLGNNIANFTTYTHNQFIEWNIPQDQDYNNYTLCVTARIYLKNGTTCNIIKCTRIFCPHEGLQMQFNSEQENFKEIIFPNPIERGGLLQLRNGALAEGVDIEIFDYNQKLVQKSKNNRNQVRLDSNLSAGIYYLKVLDNRKDIIYKFIIQ